MPPRLSNDPGAISYRDYGGMKMQKCAGLPRMCGNAHVTACVICDDDSAAPKNYLTNRCNRCVLLVPGVASELQLVKSPNDLRILVRLCGDLANTFASMMRSSREQGAWSGE